MFSDSHFFSLSSVMLCMINGTTGQLCQVSTGFSKTLGFSQDYLLHQLFQDLVHPDDLAVTLHALAFPTQPLSELVEVNPNCLRQAQTTEKLPSTSSSNGCTFSNRYRCQTGHYRWLAWEMTRDMTANTIYAVATPIDVDKAIHEAAERYQLLLEHSLLGIMFLQQDASPIAINPAVEQLLGYSEQEVCRLKITGITHPDDIARSINFLKQLVAGEIDSYHIEKRYVRKDRSIIWCSVSVVRLSLLASEFKYLVMLQDITQRKIMEQTLRTKEERFELAMRASNDGIWDWNLITNDVFYSTRWKSMLGYKEYEIEPYVEAFMDLLHPAERERVMNRNYAYINGETSHYESFHRMRHKNGSYRWVLSRGCVVRDAHGKPYRMVGTHTDMTAQKQTEQALQESKEFLDTIINAIPSCIFVKDRQHHYILLNRATCDYIGHPYEFLIGKSPAELFSDPQKIADFNNTDEQVFMTGKDLVMDYPYIDKQGKSRTVLTHKTLYTNQQGKQFIIGILTDVTERKRIEQALQESKEFLDKIINTIPHLIYVKDWQHRWVVVNQALCQILDKSHEELLGRDGYEFFPREQVDFFRQIDDQVFISGQTVTAEEMFTSHGEIRHGLSTKGLYIDKQGRQFIVGSTVDITDLKRQEAALYERDHLLQSVAQAIQLLLTNTDQQTANQQALAIVGQITQADRAYIFENHPHPETEEIVASRRIEWCAENVAPLMNDPMLQNLSYTILPTTWYESLLNGQAVQGLPRNFSPPLHHFFKRHQTLSLLLVPIHFNQRLWGVIGITDCQSERVWSTNHIFMLQIVGDSLRGAMARQTAELALSQQSQRNQLILEVSMDGFYVVGRNGRIKNVNRAICQMTGYTPEELIGTLSEQLEPTMTPAQIANRLLLIMQQGSARFETQLRHKQGHLIAVEISTNFVQFTNDDAVLFSFIRDIREHKRANEELRNAKEAAEVANIAKSNFLATMSHEIRTPMNGVIGMADLLLDTRLDAQQRDYLQTLRSSGESLLTIINDILDFSKIEAGKLVLEQVEFDLHHLLEEIINTFAVVTDSKGIELLCQLPPPPLHLQGDPSRLRQVLTNLLGNAVKFTNKGEVLLRVSLLEQKADKRQSTSTSSGQVKFEVIDTGIGISAATQQRLFQPFSQADSSTTRRFGGTGLGLVIVQRIVKIMGGDIGIDSTVGIGSNFWFILTFEHALTPAIGTDNDMSQLRDLRLLIIDDNTDSCALLQYYAQHWGMQTMTVNDASTGLLALRKAMTQAQPYDIVIIDRQMPMIDGLTLAQAIQADNRFANLAIIMLTPISQPLDNESASRLAAYLTKPVSYTKLGNALLKAININNPLSEVQNSPLDGSETSQMVSNEIRERMQILVVEDNPTNQKVAQIMLKKLDCEVALAAHGKEALEMLGQQHYDLIFMDCQMPEMDGFVATTLIRQQEQTSTTHIPIIALTANAMPGDIERCRAVGMDDYVSKPFKSQELAAILKRWLNKSSQS